MRPLWKSNAAPTPIISVASSFGKNSAMNFSCFGVLKPTHKMSGFAARTIPCNSFSSSGFNGRNGGVNVPAISSFGNFAFNFSASDFRHARRAAEEKVAARIFFAPRADIQHQVRPIDAAHFGWPRILPIQTIGIPSGVQRNASFKIRRNASSLLRVA